MMRIWNKNDITSFLVIISGVCAVCSIVVAASRTFPPKTVEYVGEVASAGQALPIVISTPQHVKTPTNLKAVYMTSWAAGNEKFRKELFDLVDTTEINAVVIDVKDYTGKISFPVDDPTLKAFGSSEDRIPDIKDLVAILHSKNVYVIARISSFQDSFLTKTHPEWAVKTK